MTFSICAYDPATGQLGVGAITAMLGVGKLVSHARAGVGAAASQAMMNPYLALDGLELMTTGQTAQQALEEVISRDDGRDYRQVGVVDAQGNTAAWSGARTEDWSGHLQRGSAVAQGNRLVGIETLEATLDAFYDNQHLDLAHRLLRALRPARPPAQTQKAPCRARSMSWTPRSTRSGMSASTTPRTPPPPWSRSSTSSRTGCFRRL